MRKSLNLLAMLGLLAASSAAAGSYTVRQGDTMSVIAARAGTTVGVLARINNLLNPDQIDIGQVLRISDSSPTTYTVRRGDTLAIIAGRTKVPVASLVKINQLANPDRIEIGQVLRLVEQPTSYTVRKGDSLAVIAKRFGTTVKALMDLNAIKHQDRIRVGQVLRLPGSSPNPAPAPARSPAPAPSMAPIASVHLVAAGRAPTYTVARGDNAQRIASRNKISTAALAKANPGVNMKTLPVGITITLPLRPVWICPVKGPTRFDDSWGAFRADTGRHVGTDMLAARGTPVVAPVGGTLELKQGKIGGNAFYIHGDDGNSYYGAHLDAYSAGSGRIEAGQEIGKVGDTGDAKGTPPHLHFEFHPNGGPPVDSFFTLEAWC